MCEFNIEMLDKNRPPFYWLNKNSRTFLQRGYLLPGVSAEERIRDIANQFQEYVGDKLPGIGDKFYYYMSRGWFSLSSPIWSNYGTERGLPISCFGSYIDDSIEDIMSTLSEVAVMSKYGGGTSGYFGKIRPQGSIITNNGKSDGSHAFARLYDLIIDVISQGTTRKGQFAGYIDIDHGDIDDWLNIRKEGDSIQLMFYGVCVSDDWIESMKAGDSDKRNKWARLLQCRNELGIPYIFFSDTVNNYKPKVYIDNNMEIYASNMCTEIALPSSKDESFVCCLSSMNLLYWDEWKDTDAVKVLSIFLDTVMTEFVTKSKKIKYLEKASKFAERHRALGLGVLGWHTLLQSKMLPFDSDESYRLNNQIFKYLKEKTDEATAEMAELFGEPELLKGYSRRNTTMMAIAPTKSSSYILGNMSQGIEPLKSNLYIQDLAKIKSDYQNPFLAEILRKYGKDDESTWKSILDSAGSVQHLDFLSELEKNVFKTFTEISQLAIIQLAAQRQIFIDQAQSINLMIHPNTPAKEINKLTLTAWDLGVKSLYYQHSMNSAQSYNRKLLTECESCSA